MPGENGNFLVPDLKITDQSLESSGWRFTDGWNNLVPGQSSLEDVVAKFGQPNEQCQLANGVTYEFLQGGVNLTILEGEQKINCLCLYPEKLALNAVPRSLKEALAAFGKLELVRVDRREGAIYERPGMRICAQANSEDQQILWLEIFCPAD